MESPFCGTTGMSSTLSRELNHGEEHVRLGLLEHELHDRRDVHSPTSLAWRCTPVGGPLGVGGATPPPVSPRRPTELRPNVPIRTHEERLRDDVSHDLRHFHLVLHTRHKNVSRGRRRHVHQLFRQLRITYQASRRDVLEDDLGHFNNLLGNRHKRIDEPEHIHQLFHHQRHRNIKRREPKNGVDDLFHGVPLNLLLRPDLGEPVKPRPAGLFVKRRREHSTRCIHTSKPLKYMPLPLLTTSAALEEAFTLKITKFFHKLPSS